MQSLSPTFYRTEVHLGSDIWVQMSVSDYKTVLRLANEDTNSIQTDDVKVAIQCKVAMQMVPSGGQICK